MKDEAEEQREEKGRGGWVSWMVWPACLVLLYVLSSGPVWMIWGNGTIPADSAVRRVTDVVYWPLTDVVGLTRTLGKALRMFWSLWVPQYFNAEGTL